MTLTSGGAPATSSRIRVSPLRGRGPEFAVIETALANAQTGQGAALLIEGRAGFGKTRLLEESSRLAQHMGMRVGVGRADVDDTATPMSPLVQACFGGHRPLLQGLDSAALPPGMDRY